MEYTHILDLVPEGEYFDSSALNSEGIWISKMHFDSIEQRLQQDKASLASLSDSLQQKESELNGLMTLKEENDALKKEVSNQQKMIESLELEVAKLGKEPSGGGTVMTVKEDTIVENTKVPSYLDDNNPINQFADSRLPKMKTPNP